MSPDLVTQLRAHSNQLADAAPSIDELLQQLMVGPVEQEASPPVVHWRRPWVTAVAAAVVILLAVGLAPLLARWLTGTEPAGVVEIVETLNRLTVDDIPAVRMVASYEPGGEREDIPDGGLIRGGTVEILYSPEIGYRLTFIEGDDPANPPGSYLVSDREFVGWYRNTIEEPGGFRVEEAAPFYPPSWQTDFSQVCDPDDVELLDQALMAGRAVIGLRCTPLRGEWSIWVDEESGLVLRIEGRYGVGGEVALFLDDEGTFEVESLELDPQFDAGAFDTSHLPQPPGEQPSPIVASLPPFRALVSMSLTTDEASGAELETYTALVELWYRGPNAWEYRMIESDSGLWLAAGSIEVQSGHERATYDSDLGGYYVDGDQTEFPPFLNGLIGDQPDRRLGEVCAEGAAGESLGRPVQTYECVVPGAEQPRTLVVDEETGLVLRNASDMSVFEVLELELDPVFPPDALVFDLPGRNLTEQGPGQPLVGQAAPPLALDLIDGTPFDLDVLRGQRIAVLFWATWCSPCLDALDDFQAALDFLGDDVVFVAVASLDDIEAVSEVARRGQLGVLIPFDGDGSAMDAWSIDGVPWLLLIDAGGVVVDGHVGKAVTENLPQLILDAEW